MLNIEITETKNFVKKLLMEPVFDTFLLVEAYVRSDVSYTIDGRLNPSFFDTEELEEMTSNTYTTWGAVRHHIFNVILIHITVVCYEGNYSFLYSLKIIICLPCTDYITIHSHRMYNHRCCWHYK